MTRPIATSDDKAEPETHVRWTAATMLYAIMAWINSMARWFITKPMASVTYVLAGIAIIFALSLLGGQAHKAAVDATVARERADRLAGVTAQMKRQQGQIAELVHFQESMTMQQHITGERERYSLCTTQRDSLRVIIRRLRVRMPHEYRNPLAAQDEATARDLEGVMNRIGPCEPILTGGTVGL